MASNDLIIEIINDRFNSLEETINHRLDRIEDNMVKKYECKSMQQSCLNNLNNKKSELSIKRITAIGGVITGTITASASIVAFILKLFFP